MIRKATLADMPQMLVNARTFIDSSAYKGLCDDESMRLALTQMMEDGLLLVDAEEDGTHLGGIGCIKSPMFFNQSIAVANERFWWVKPDKRAVGVGRGLLAAIVVAAQDAGCQKLMMLSLASPEVDEIYKRLGFAETEHCFMRDL